MIPESQRIAVAEEDERLMTHQITNSHNAYDWEWMEAARDAIQAEEDKTSERDKLRQHQKEGMALRFLAQLA